MKNIIDKIASSKVFLGFFIAKTVVGVIILIVGIIFLANIFTGYSAMNGFVSQHLTTEDVDSMIQEVESNMKAHEEHDPQTDIDSIYDRITSVDLPNEYKFPSSPSPATDATQGTSDMDDFDAQFQDIYDKWASSMKTYD